jgi:two-component system, NtrC family, nitrogen regulation sensor histidine kinase NtrY
MFKILKNFNWIILYSILCIFLGILTFLTFINESFIPLNDKNLQILLIINIILISVFFYIIFKNIYRYYNIGKKKRAGYQTSIKYVSTFALFTLVPSLMVAIFSLFIFNFGIENYFDNQIKKAVNNSYNVAKNYLETTKENVKSDIILMSVGLNRVSNFYYSNPKRFRSIVKAEKILRRIDDVYLIDSAGNILFSDVISKDEEFSIPSEDNYNLALDGNSVFVANVLENKTSVMLKLNTLVDTYLYISRNIDKDILEYLNETEQAVSFYYSIENSQTGIKITFAIIYIIIVSLLLFICIVLAISFATRFTIPIINLIKASDSISKGELDTKVPSIESDEEFKKLNNNFNNMIERLKKQQDKLLISERYAAWETVARKLAHEIKNPLTPIQLSIDRLREKYSNKISDQKEDFERYLQTINRQIKDIEKLVNEFSSFARMPRPLMKNINIYNVIKRSYDLFKITSKSEINLIAKNKKLLIKGDEEQLNRVFLNLFKNSEESIQEKSLKLTDFKGKIDVVINENNHYIIVSLSDNGTGVSDIKKAMNPYFTTKKKGTGLGLPIVSKIINEHSGEFLVKNKDIYGAVVTISLPKLDE